MILQALQKYYSRLKHEGVPDLEMEGFKRVEIPFLIVIRDDGTFVGFDDTRDSNGKGRPCFVPKIFEGSRTVNIKANLLWDKASYVFGVSPKTKADRLVKQKQKFRETIEEFFLSPPAKVSAVLKFLDCHVNEVESDSLWTEIAETDPNLAFRLEGETCLITDADEIRSVLEGNGEDSVHGICLITGSHQPLARLENPIKGLRGSGKAESHLVAFNESAYWSHAKKDKIRYGNAQIGKAASFEYVAAINYLQRKKPLYISDTTTIYWAGEKHHVEDIFADLFGEPAPQNPDQLTQTVRSLYAAPHAGTPPLDHDLTPFFVLGLAPNAARIAIRFWYAGTVGSVAANIKGHFDDTSIVRADYQRPCCSLDELLAATAVETKDPKKTNRLYFRGKFYDVAPNLAGDFTKAILAGTPYPRTLLVAVVNRIRAEQSKKDQNGKSLQNVTYPRAALIKALLVRESRCYKHTEKEVGMSLDVSNTNPGYLLGRLFAVLEKVQAESAGGWDKINATIRDRFYGAASSTPVAVFPHLMKLKNHHLSKIENYKWFYEGLIGEVVSKLDPNVAFPTHLSLQDQGRFAVGYYHQRQDFFKKNETTTNVNP